MTRYERVLEILDNSIGGPTVEIGVHGAFWRGLSRDQFVRKRVRGLDLITLQDGANSALVKALRGEALIDAGLTTLPQGSTKADCKPWWSPCRRTGPASA